jgi:hypothetical protein
VTETSTEAPIMVRVNITRDELVVVKKLALDANKTSQELLADIIRAHIANS